MLGIALFRRHITSIMPNIKTFIFIDLETTGLPQYENNKTKITELCAVAVQADHIMLGVFPRVQNKLSLCFNPCKMIDPVASHLTGLSNDLLENQAKFSSATVDLIKNWLDLHRKPLCLVAHNGDRFDYPILRTEIDKTGNNLPEDILCVDSLTAFRELDTQEIVTEEPQPTNENIPPELQDGYDELLVECLEEYEKSLNNNQSEMQKINETTPKKQMIQPGHVTNQRNVKKQPHRLFKSYKLGDVYSRLTCKEIQGAHEAQTDVSMMVTCAAVYAERFVEYADKHARNLCDIPVLKVGGGAVRN